MIRALSRLSFLSWTGIGLSLAHLLTSFSWIFDGFYLHFTPESTMAACHAFWLSCLDFQIPVSGTLWLLGSYGLISVLATAFFLTKKQRPALALLTGLTLFKLLFFVLRFNVMGNYHLLHFFMSSIFLCLPRKKFSLTLGIVCLYVMAGLLKLNSEWLSGAALISKPLLSGKWLSLALCYVIVLETLVVWGLFSDRRWLRGATLFQLFLFHAFSWHLVGYFYPLTMLCLLLPFLVDLREESTGLHWKQLHPVTAVFLVMTFAFQIRPVFTKRDPALSGRLRSFRINMLDARPQCTALALLEDVNMTTSLNLSAVTSLRTRCDTSVFETQLKAFCDQPGPTPKIRYVLYSKRSLDESYQIIENVGHICRRNTRSAL